MRWFVRKVLVWFGVIRPYRSVAMDPTSHNATIRRADKLLRYVHDYQAAEDDRKR
jgi:hypothetical protein